MTGVQTCALPISDPAERDAWASFFKVYNPLWNNSKYSEQVAVFVEPHVDTCRFSGIGAKEFLAEDDINEK